ncbi:3-phosphoshikimate 1-carboxyvinyltransferase [Bifidobacterium psychraerophilum]|uniref:3-phosphoshikimate 1-carboxyvinyltransferase n=1 Tax=Bifidobacterium psychraerophilum TaxID=218140 RepID=UPI0039E7B70E
MTDMTADPNIQESWPAPAPQGPLHARVKIPGSKSLSNRYLLLAAAGSSTVTLHGLLRSRDSELMMGALETLGVRVSSDADDPTTVSVSPPGSGRYTGNVTIDCGLAGTVMRFVPGLAMLADGPVTFDGDSQAYQRPMAPLLEGLEQLGADIVYHGEPGHLPFTLVPPSQWNSGKVAIDASASSQFISGILLIAPALPHGVILKHTGKTLPSLPHVRMTVDDLKHAGAQVKAHEYQREWLVEPGSLHLPPHVTIEPDLSNAAPFLGAALLAGGSVEVPNWPEQTTQPGGLLPGYLSRMGADVSFIEEEGTRWCRVSSDGTIHGLGDFDLTAAGEIAPSLAALLVFADAGTNMLGIGHLRGHETNRLAALVQEIGRIGGEAQELPDGISITPVPQERLHAADLHSYADHRMATFGAMLALRIHGITVENIGTTSKTLPDFVEMWRSMLNNDK